MMQMLDESQIVNIARLANLALLCLILFTASLTRRTDKIGLYSGYGLVLIYFCYAFSGITFGNGVSLAAEFFYVILTGALIFGITIGGNYSNKLFVFLPSGKSRLKPSQVTPPVSKFYLVLTSLVFFLYLNILTNWNPLLILTQATELKHYRLNLILVEKNFILFLLESTIIALLSIGFTWAVISHKDDKYSDRVLYVFVFFAIVQVISTGARSPIIGFFILFLVALSEGKKSSQRMASISKSIRRYFSIVAAIGLVYMGWSTSSRIEFEGLTSNVFKIYFDIVDFGFVSTILDMGSAISFLFGTIIVYAASTFNNFVLRFQYTSEIDHSFGYQFFFPYAGFLEKLLGDSFDSIITWRLLSSRNNDILSDVADSATQWSTIFGDFLWDFGIIGSMIAILLVASLLGYFIGRTKFHPSTASIILKLYIMSFLLMPLINPFGAMQFHITLIILIFFNSIFSEKRHQQFNTKNDIHRSVVH